jgi:RNA recognition motif-containing protein
MNQRLYVGNLSPGITEAELRLLFSRIGAVIEVQLNLDPTTRQSRGHAFVTMATPELGLAALRELHGYSLGGRYIAVTEARPPQEAKGLISEGFNHGPSAPFRPSDSQSKRRRNAPTSSRHRHRDHGR